MPKTKFIKDFLSGEKINDIFLLTHKQLCVGKNDNQYLSLKLADKTGEIDGKKWNISSENEFDDLVEGKYYNITGLVNEYNGNLQFRVDSIAKTSENCNSADFLASSPKDINDMKKKLNNIIVSVKDEKCKKLLHYFFDNQSFYNKFIEAPAAMTFHHAYVSGLLEHTLDVCNVADKVASVYYEIIKRDVLITGALLHDMAKIREYKIKSGIEFTSEGQFMGHLVMGASMVEAACKELDLDEEFCGIIAHMILSHHGKLEYGSPKVPCTLEAMVLHMADELSFKVHYFVNLVQGDKSDDAFTKNNKTNFETRLYKGFVNEYLEKKDQEEKEQKITDDFLREWGK